MVAVVYSFTIYEEVLKKKVECRVDVGSMWSWMENIFNKMRRGGKIIKLWRREQKLEEVNVVKKR